MNVHHLQENRAAKVAEMRALGSNLDGDNAARFDALEAEVRGLDGQIRRAVTLAEMERQAEAAPDASMERELRSYSVAKAIREAAAGNLTGLEAEMNAELGKGREVRGIMVPTHLLLGETRAQTVGTAANGGNTVATNLGGLIDLLRPTLAVQSMGATVISGLVGTLDLPRLTAGPTAKWLAEDGSAVASDATFDKVSLSPKTVSGEMYMSRRLVLQNSVALEDVLRQDLGFILAQALDKAAIQGGGTNEPVGIIEAVTENATAETELSDIAADLIGAVEIDDVLGTGAFLASPTLMASARKVKDENNRIIPVSEIFHNQPVTTSSNVPNDGSSPASEQLIYGVWNHLMVGYWGGTDILANPYSDASKGGLRLHAFLDADVAVRHPEAFAWKTV